MKIKTLKPSLFLFLIFLFFALSVIIIEVALNFIKPISACAAVVPASKPNPVINIKKSYKRFGAYIIKKDVVLKLNNNYGFKEYVAESVKILSQRGINKYSEVIVPFSTKYQKIKLLYAYTLLKKGMFKVPVGRHAVNFVSPSFAVNYPAYSDIKYMTLSMPAVEDGSVINFSYEINNFKPLIKKGIFYTDYFSFTVPARTVAFSIIYPKGLRLGYYFHGINKNQVSKKTIIIKNKKFIECNISINNIPAIKKESNMPPLKNYRKYVSISTYNSWSGLVDRLSDLFIKAEKPSRKIKKFVKTNNHVIVHNIDANNLRQKVAAIYYRFVKTFRYVGLGYGLNGYKPESGNKTFINGYGDSKSLAALFITMLKVDGINAYPILLTSLNTSNFNVQNISPKQFDSVIVGLTLKTKGKDKMYYLYPDSSSYKAFKVPFSLAGRKGIVLFSPNNYKFIKIPSEKASDNEKVFLFKGRLYKNGDLKGKYSIIYKGIYSNYERSSLKSLDNYNKKIKAYNFLYSLIPGSYINYFKYKNINKIDKNLRLYIKFFDKNYGTLNKDKLIFHSIVSPNMNLIKLVLKRKRLYPLIIGYPFEHIIKINLKLPKKSNIYYLPQAFKFNNKTISVNSSCNFSKRNEELSCNYKFKSKKPTISVEEYRQYRQAARNYAQYLRNDFIALSSIYFY